MAQATGSVGLSGKRQRWLATILLGLIIGGWVVASELRPAPAAPEAWVLRVAAGPLGSASYRAAQTLAAGLSQPPDLPPCQADQPCGLPNLVASVQATARFADAVEQVADAAVETAVAPAAVVFARRCGVGGVPAAGDQTPVLAPAWPETLRLIVGVRLAGLADAEALRGQRIAVGDPGSAVAIVAPIVLEALGLPRGSYRPAYLTASEAAAALAADRIDALIALGPEDEPAFVPLFAQQQGHIWPLPEPARATLRARLPIFVERLSLTPIAALAGPEVASALAPQPASPVVPDIPLPTSGLAVLNPPQDPPGDEGMGEDGMPRFGALAPPTTGDSQADRLPKAPPSVPRLPVPTLTAAAVWIAPTALDPDLAGRLVETYWRPPNRDRLGGFWPTLRPEPEVPPLPAPLAAGVVGRYAADGRGVTVAPCP